MIAAGAMWALTQSAFALMFAALGPVSALAGLVDSRLGAKRTGKRELVRFMADVERTKARIARAHQHERTARAEITPTTRELRLRTGADPYRWRDTGKSPVMITVGTGLVRSMLGFERQSDSDQTPAVILELDRLERDAAELESAPLAVDARLGIGIFGTAPYATAAARSVLLQLAWRLSPTDFWCATLDSEPWLRELPHRTGPVSDHARWKAGFGASGVPEPLALVAVAATEAELPGGCAIVIRAGGELGSAIVRHPDRRERRALRLETVSLDEAFEWAGIASADAAREGLGLADASMPASIELSGLLRRTPTTGTSTLSCEVGADPTGAVTLDLVRDGPHSVIGGTTGSGKSELLIAWVLAMAAAYSPDQVNFLLVDFKGGSAFGALSELPHTAGILTDLDEVQAARALASLRAELRQRERLISEAGARSIDDAGGVPRLVIVVDEFAAMLADHPGLHALFADIAARGRSLGVHLVLCTQRPAGVVRDSVLANADLRISLRVNNGGDSTAVVGTDAAADIAPTARGRGVLATGGRVRPVQFAIAREKDIADVASLWQGWPPMRRPWQPPLPLVVPATSLRARAGGIPFGLVDLPEEQRTGTAEWNPADAGHLVIIGQGGSGKSTTLATIAAAGGCAWLPTHIDAAWDVLATLSTNSAHGEQSIVLVDDVDSLLARFPQEYRTVFAERLAALLRDGPARGVRVVMTAQRVTSEVQPLASLCSARLMLAHPSRQEYVMAGGDGSHFVPGLGAGGGVWRGNRVQVASGAAARPAGVPAAMGELRRDRAIAIASTRVGSLPERLGGRTVIELSAVTADLRELAESDPTLAIIGDVDEWQSRWGAIASLRPVAQVLFDGCSPSDYRTLTRSRELPPPMTGDPTVCWMLAPDGSAQRVRLG